MISPGSYVFAFVHYKQADSDMAFLWLFCDFVATCITSAQCEFCGLALGSKSKPARMDRLFSPSEHRPCERGFGQFVCCSIVCLLVV